MSFAPLKPDAIKLLSLAIGVDFSYGSFEPPNWLCVTARDDRGRVMGVVACEFRTPFDATFNLAVFDPRCVSRRIMRAIFTALFSKAKRITAEIAVSNRRALNAVLRMGFVLEGYCRRGINGVMDAYVFGMLKEDCVFLRNTRPTSSRPHIPDSVVRNIEALSQSGGRISRTPDLDDLVSRQLGMRGDVAGSGDDLVGHVFLSGGPAEMPPVDAGTVDASRSMRGLFADRGGPMHSLADPVVDATHLGGAASAVNHGVAKLVSAKRPDNAVVGIAEKSGFKKPLTVAASGHSLSLNPKRKN